MEFIEKEVSPQLEVFFSKTLHDIIFEGKKDFFTEYVKALQTLSSKNEDNSEATRALVYDNIKFHMLICSYGVESQLLEYNDLGILKDFYRPKIILKKDDFTQYFSKKAEANMSSTNENVMIQFVISVSRPQYNISHEVQRAIFNLYKETMHYLAYTEKIQNFESIVENISIDFERYKNI